jgi:hypothetical protein
MDDRPPLNYAQTAIERIAKQSGVEFWGHDLFILHHRSFVP